MMKQLLFGFVVLAASFCRAESPDDYTWTVVTDAGDVTTAPTEPTEYRGTTHFKANMKTAGKVLFSSGEATYGNAGATKLYFGEWSSFMFVDGASVVVDSPIVIDSKNRNAFIVSSGSVGATSAGYFRCENWGGDNSWHIDVSGGVFSVPVKVTLHNSDVVYPAVNVSGGLFAPTSLEKCSTASGCGSATNRRLTINMTGGTFQVPATGVPVYLRLEFPTSEKTGTVTVTGEGATVFAPVNVVEGATMCCAPGDGKKLTVSGPVSGAGAVVVANGELDLTGSDMASYEGCVSVSSGRLAADALCFSIESARAVKLAGGGELKLVDFTAAGGDCVPFKSADAVPQVGKAKVAVSVPSTYIGSYRLSSGFVADESMLSHLEVDLTIEDEGEIDASLAVKNGDIVLDLKAPTRSSVRYWTGGGASDAFSDADNWQGKELPAAGDTLVFQGNVRLTPQNDYGADVDFTSVRFAGNSQFVLSGNALSVTGETAVVNVSSVVQKFNAPVVLGDGTMEGGVGIEFNGGCSVDVARVAGTLILNAPATVSSNVLLTADSRVEGVGPWTVNGKMIVESGTAVLSLSTVTNVGGVAYAEGGDSKTKNYTTLEIESGKFVSLAEYKPSDFSWTTLKIDEQATVELPSVRIDKPCCRLYVDGVLDVSGELVYAFGNEKSEVLNGVGTINAAGMYIIGTAYPEVHNVCLNLAGDVRTDRSDDGGNDLVSWGATFAAEEDIKIGFRIWPVKPDPLVFHCEDSEGTPRSILMSGRIRKGDGSVVKTGSGDLVIAGRVPEGTGAFTVKDGRLAVAENIGTFASLTVESNATFCVKVPVTCAPLLMANGSVLEFEDADPKSENACLTVNGDVSLAGVTLAMTGERVKAGRYQLLSATGTVSGLDSVILRKSDGGIMKLESETESGVTKVFLTYSRGLTLLLK